MADEELPIHSDVTYALMGYAAFFNGVELLLHRVKLHLSEPDRDHGGLIHDIDSALGRIQARRDWIAESTTSNVDSD